jgi:predicted thioesterase
MPETMIQMIVQSRELYDIAAELTKLNGEKSANTATLEKVEGRKLYFKIIAHQGDKIIGEGTHLRFIVNRKKFLAKI